MIQFLFGIWLCLLKQSCRKFYGDQFFLLLQPLKSYVKASKVLFKHFGEKKFKKKKRGLALLGRPASLSAQPDSAARFPSPLSPARGARLAPPGAGHVAAVRRHRGRAAPDRLTPVGTAPRAPTCHSVPRSSLSLCLLPPRASSCSSRSGAPPCSIGAEA